MTILPLAYLGNIEWFVHLMQEECIIDIGERWVKQSARNRCEIMTSGGVATLTVPVHGGSAHGGNNGSKIRTKDIRIDNSKNWQHRHWVSLVSAYRNSPYFDHYEEKFAPVYEKQLNYLTDLNFELLNILTTILGIAGRVQISDDYTIANPDDVDMRDKKAFRRLNNLTSGAGFIEYSQVFCDRIPFTPGLSVIDMLFCEGPGAKELLMQGRY